METAFIDETSCIGCTRCKEACPMDAIIGAHGFSHTILPQKCSGCGLCETACPVEGIGIKILSLTKQKASRLAARRARRARADFELRQDWNKRHGQVENISQATSARKSGNAHNVEDTVLAAIAKARARVGKPA